MPDFSRTVVAPDPDTINTRCHPARVSTMSTSLGRPRPTGPECRNDRASPQVRALLETRDVGPFRITGIRPFLDVVQRICRRVEMGNPALYAALGTAGVLCVRFVRGSTATPSNHCWGTAIDISILNPRTSRHELDLPLGNGRVQVGCLDFYRFVKEEAMASGEFLFWGAGFGREDGMHFEASDELVRQWKAQGKLG
jgi:hypothetical protein